MYFGRSFFFLEFRIEYNSKNYISKNRDNMKEILITNIFDPSTKTKFHKK